MGSKKSPPPDPAQQELARAQVSSMKAQQEFDRETFDWMKGEALQQQQRGDEEYKYQRGISDENMRRSTEDRQFFYDTTAKQTRKYNDEVDAFDTEDRRGQLAGQAVSDIEGAMSLGRSSLGRGLAMRGMNGGGPQAMAMMMDQELDGSLAKAGAATMARDAARREGLQLRASAAGLGSPFGSMSSSALGAASDTGMRSLAAGGTGMAAYGAAAGMRNQGSQVANSWGSSANSTYNSLADQNYKRSQSGSSGIGSLLGGVAGAFMGPMGGQIGGMAGKALGGKLGLG